MCVYVTSTTLVIVLDNIENKIEVISYTHYSISKKRNKVLDI